MTNQLRPFQLVGVEYILDRPCTLLADEMGLGKTIQTIGAINGDSECRRILIVCPAVLKTNWEKELGRWLTRELNVFIISGQSCRWPKVRKPTAVIVNFDILAAHRAAIDRVRWDLLVVDESQYCKSTKARRTKAIIGGRLVIRGARRTLKPLAARRKVFLTGTPILDNPIDLWPTIKLFDPKGLGASFFRFTQRYCRTSWTRWGVRYTGAKHEDELRKYLRSRFMIRRLKSEVLTDLPPKVRQVIELQDRRAKSLIQQEKTCYRSYREYLDNGQKRKARRVKFTQLARVRYELAMQKLPLIIEHLTDCLTQAVVVCFVRHREIAASLARHFTGESVAVTGDLPTVERAAICERFQNGAWRMLVGTIDSIGVGISLTRAQLCVFGELDWTPSKITQAEDRCHRIGQRGSVLVQHLVLEDSLDARFVKVLVRKQELTERILDQGDANAKSFCPKRGVG